MAHLVHPTHYSLCRKITRLTYIQVQGHQLEWNVWEVIKVFNSLMSPANLNQGRRTSITKYGESRKLFEDYYQRINEMQSEIFGLRAETVSEAYLDSEIERLREICHLIRTAIKDSIENLDEDNENFKDKLEIIRNLTFVNFAFE